MAYKNNTDTRQIAVAALAPIAIPTTAPVPRWSDVVAVDAVGEFGFPSTVTVGVVEPTELAVGVLPEMGSKAELAVV